ncbi:hypothetical protein [Croceimicrobium sp.]|uniref:hypothetical protein n=1 Tax=Croceimicrobium sp. TaxID=2828340 RepID=UPI003BA8CA11
MTKEEVKYILNYFSHLMPQDDRLTLKYHMYTHSKSDEQKLRKAINERAETSEKVENQEMPGKAYEEFALGVAKKIVNQYPDKLYFNRCPKCNSLARTPYSRQCKSCGFNWHENALARFKLERSFQLIGRQFFLLGQITKGEIKIGQFIDLKMLGLSRRAEIEAVEFYDKRENGKVQAGISLGLGELSEEEKEFIKRLGSFETPIDIFAKN